MIRFFDNDGYRDTYMCKENLNYTQFFPTTSGSFFAFLFLTSWNIPDSNNIQFLNRFKNIIFFFKLYRWDKSLDSIEYQYGNLYFHYRIM